MSDGTSIDILDRSYYYLLLTFMDHEQPRERKKSIALHWQILIGMLLGILAGFIAARFGKDGISFINNWISPFGVIFLNLLKLLAVPLIIASLIKGICGLQDISKLSKMGTQTLLLYIATTVVAITIGLLLVNVISPGQFISEDTRLGFMNQFESRVSAKIQSASIEKSKGPLQPLIELVPSNIFQAAASNKNMLQIIFFVILFGIGIILIPQKKARPIIDFFDSLNEVIMKLIDLVMLVAPIGVFALLAGLIVDAPGSDILKALAFYSVCVLTGLAFMVFIFYPSLVRIYTKRSYRSFFNGILPAQLLAFSTSSSAATLPVTMERVTEHLGVDEDVSSFVLPIGATVNMDGTSLYQGVAAVFIAQVFGNDLTLYDQLTIVITATLASIGSAAVPGAGLLMLIIVLEAIGVNPAGLALILAVDRPLDMCRTAVNVTGDAAVSMLVAKKTGKLHDPLIKNWDDEYKK